MSNSPLIEEDPTGVFVCLFTLQTLKYGAEHIDSHFFPDLKAQIQDLHSSHMSFTPSLDYVFIPLHLTQVFCSMLVKRSTGVHYGHRNKTKQWARVSRKQESLLGWTFDRFLIQKVAPKCNSWLVCFETKKIYTLQPFLFINLLLFVEKKQSCGWLQWLYGYGNLLTILFCG